MSEIKTWAFSVCVAAVIGGVVSMIIPNGKMEKVMQVVISIFFISCLVIPLISILPNIEIDYQDFEEEEVKEIYLQMETLVNEQMLNKANNNIESNISNRLKENNINYKKIDIIYNTFDSSSISITKIDIYINKENTGQAEEICSKISQELEVPVNVIQEGA